MNRVLAASLALLIAGCTAAAAAPDSASAPAAAPATTQRVLFDMGPAYFPGALPHGETLVGAPPAAGSDAMARDERLSAAGVALYGSELIDDPARFDTVVAVGLDQTVFVRHGTSRTLAWSTQIATSPAASCSTSCVARRAQRGDA